MSLGRRTVSVVRPAGAFDDVTGRWEETTGKPFTIEASIQPLGPRELKSLPEGRNPSATFRLYTDFRLRTVDEKARANPDRVTLAIGGDTLIRTYEVISIAEWQNGIVPHYKAIVSLLDQDPDGVAEP